MSWTPPGQSAVQHSTEPEQEEFPIVGDHHEVLGVPSGEEAPALYDTRKGRVFRSDVDESEGVVRPRPEPEWELAPEETLGELLERVGDEVGWDSLSAFAERHLEDEE